MDTGSVVKQGTFAVPEGTRGDALGRATYQAVKKFGEALVKQGWTLLAAPVVRPLTPQPDTYKPMLSNDKKIVLWMPQTSHFHEDHPWFEPGMDQYQVAWRCTRRPFKWKVHLPDGFVQRHGLPVGFKLEE